jgi:NADH-quinone oxidoreductase subunit E
MKCKEFCFNEENLKEAKKIIKKYPDEKEQSAILGLLDIAQRQNGGHLTQSSMEYVANFLNMKIIKIYEIATFYSMFNLNPIGKYHIQICTNISCMLQNSYELLDILEKKLEIKSGEKSKDCMFSLKETECLGACTEAPVAQINDDYYYGIDKIIGYIKSLQTLKRK